MLAVVLAALQALAPVPPRALHDAGNRLVRFRTATDAGHVGWDALQRTVSLCGYRKEPELLYERVVRVDFRPTAAAGLDAGRLAVAGRDGERVRIELWRVEDSHEADGEPSYGIVARDVVWESVEADSIGLLVWNPAPPRDARISMRGLWYQRRELERFDVDRAGWASPTLEASMRGPTPPDVLHVAELREPLGRCFLGEHPERGLVTMLRTPCSCVMCCVCDPETTVHLALLDADRDGRLDGALRLDTGNWGVEGLVDLVDYARLFE